MFCFCGAVVTESCRFKRHVVLVIFTSPFTLLEDRWHNEISDHWRKMIMKDALYKVKIKMINASSRRVLKANFTDLPSCGVQFSVSPGSETFTHC
jgi:hypothetical protein